MANLILNYQQMMAIFIRNTGDINATFMPLTLKNVVHHLQTA